MSSTNRVLGIVSGFDTETLVTQLMDAENLKLEKLEKEKQYAEWEQEAYQSVVSMLTEFKSTYFDVLNSDTNITSSTFFAEFTNSVTQNGVSSSVVSVRANATADMTSHTIDSITQLATKDTWSGLTSGLRGITSEGFTFGDFQTTIGGEDLEFSLTIGGVTKSISIDNTTLGTYVDENDLVAGINSKIEAAFGSDYSNVASIAVDGELHFDMSGATITILEGTTSTGLSALSIDNGQASGDYQEKTLFELYGLEDADLSGFEINGVSITLSEDDTIEEAMAKINASDANVTLKFNSLQDAFVLTSKSEGSANNITIEDGSSAEAVFAKLFGVADVVDATGTDVNGIREEGLNAQLVLDGEAIIQSSNTFTYEGISYTLKGTTDTTVNIDVDVDADAIVDKIKEFVTDYNNILEYMNTKLSEKKYYDYEPLTDEEREALSDTDVELWEEKAKSGILRGATELNSMLTSFRNSFIDKVQDSGISLNSIGISTTSYSDKGKLTIDESALTEAIETNYSEVVSLFTQESDYKYTDGSNRISRYSENGLGRRIEDIVKDYVRTTRDTSGNKGILIEKVGIENDASYYSNIILDKLNDYDERIADMIDLLADKEEHYYTMFASMEAALSDMQNQYDSLFSSLGSS